MVLQIKILQLHLLVFIHFLLKSNNDKSHIKYCSKNCKDITKVLSVIFYFVILDIQLDTNNRFLKLIKLEQYRRITQTLGLFIDYKYYSDYFIIPVLLKITGNVLTDAHNAHFELRDSLSMLIAHLHFSFNNELILNFVFEKILSGDSGDINFCFSNELFPLLLYIILWIIFLKSLTMGFCKNIKCMYLLLINFYYIWINFIINKLLQFQNYHGSNFIFQNYYYESIIFNEKYLSSIFVNYSVYNRRRKHFTNIITRLKVAKNIVIFTRLQEC
ncbi:hypothetical protein AGLY_002666 [Aphis glycines]|uniref:Uncharacterized protein n=1 Tax=Aphis glycines TaxID=307491 RepID=A0A6G0U0Y3_APHGL|nr:hypothetical protein AGLY_002666 [Aphis glycines]